MKNKVLKKVSTKIIIAFGVSASILAASTSLSKISPASKNSLKSHSFKSITQALTQLLSMNEAFAGSFGGGLTANLTNSLRAGISNVIGYSSTNSYTNLACGGTPGCQGPPQEGIVGALTTIVNGLKTVGQSAGITECASIPSAGSITGTDSSGQSVGVNFQIPTHTIPANWSNGGTTFSKRVTFNSTVVGTPIALAYEFNCGDSPSAYLAVSMTMDNVVGYTRDITLYNGPVDSLGKNGIQLFMAEHDRTDSTHVRSSYAIDIHYNDSTKIFSLWGVLNGNMSFASGNGLNFLMKLNANGNYSTAKALVFNRAISYVSANGDNTGKFDPAIFSATGASDATLEGDPGNTSMDSDLTSDTTLRTGVSFGSPGIKAVKACIDFNAPNTASSPSAADCSGFTLVAPTDPKPALDSNGSWSIAWAGQTMGTKLEALTVP
jgi:hypothetical protein